MKKSFVFALMFFLIVLGCLSGYLFYKNNAHHPHFSKDKDSEYNISNRALSFSPNQNLKSWEDEPSWEKFSKKEQIFPQDVLENKSSKPSEKNKPVLSKPISIEKPKMAIIIDDIAYPSQLQSLHRLGLKITPSFFPYNADNKLTPKMASKETFYMVHLPLEALHFYQSPHRWIKLGEQKSQIEEYIKQIKHDFPKLKFINNHTGSKFTASYEDMKNLIEILRKYDIDFLDSRTTVQSKAPQIYAEMKRPLLSRGIFLDNKDSIDDIIIQIQKAIKKAKKDGYVIVICHPHKNTFKALEISKQSLLQEVELVYIKDIQKMRLDEK